MTYRVDGVKNTTVGTTAVDIDLGYNTCILSNAGTTTIYVKEKSEDGIAATADNAFAIPKATVVQLPLQAKTLSAVSSGAGGILSIILVQDWC